jgi:hypothetical protein
MFVSVYLIIISGIQITCLEWLHDIEYWTGKDMKESRHDILRHFYGKNWVNIRKYSVWIAGVLAEIQTGISQIPVRRVTI